MAILVFLDIDLSLRRESSLYKLEADLVANLERYVAELENEFSVVEIVITSTWRTALSLDEIRAHFPPALRLKIVGVTPSFPGRDRSRHEEILAYLRGLEETKWLAIDDRAEEFAPGLTNLLRDPEMGLDFPLRFPRRGFNLVNSPNSACRAKYNYR